MVLSMKLCHYVISTEMSLKIKYSGNISVDAFKSVGVICFFKLCVVSEHRDFTLAALACFFPLPFLPCYH